MRCIQLRNYSSKVQSDDSTGHDALTQLIIDFSQYLAVQCSTKCPTFDHMIVHKKGFQSHYINSKINLEDSSLFCLATDAPVLDFGQYLPWVSRPGWIQGPWLPGSPPARNGFLKFIFSATLAKFLIMAVGLLLPIYLFKQTIGIRHQSLDFISNGRLDLSSRGQAMNSTKLSAAEDFFKKESIPVGCISPAFPSSGACWEANPPYQCMPPPP